MRKLIGGLLIGSLFAVGCGSSTGPTTGTTGKAPVDKLKEAGMIPKDTKTPKADGGTGEKGK